MAIYCSTPIPDPLNDLCASEPGRVIAVAAVRTDANVRTDQTTLATWNADIAAGRVKIFKNVRGGKDKSSPVSVDGFGRSQTRTVSRDFTAQYFHRDVVGNEDVYNEINYNDDHSCWLYTLGKKIFDPGDATADWDGDFVIDQALNTEIMFDVTVTWSSRLIPVAYDATSLTSIFE